MTTTPHATTMTCWPAPAKLNLFLHITGRRADGYHDLQTLFALLDFGDELQITPTEDGVITLTPVIDDIPVESNLIYRAARLLQAHTGCSRGAQIHLIKRLPMGGGWVAAHRMPPPRWSH